MPAESGAAQYSLRLLVVIVTLWSVLIALAAPSWGNCVPLLTYCLVLTACVLGLGEFLARQVLLRRIMALLCGVGLAISFVLPVFPLPVGPGTMRGWDAFRHGLEMLGAVYDFSDLQTLQGWGQVALQFVTIIPGAVATIVAFAALVTACWPRENCWRRIAGAVCGLGTVSAYAVPLFFFMPDTSFSVLREFLVGYYVWLACLTGIWLAHAPRRHWSTWALFGWAALIFALSAGVGYLSEQSLEPAAVLEDSEQRNAAR